MRKTRFLFLFVVFLVSIAGLYGQVTVRGTLLDQDTSEPLIGAAVVVEGTSTGATTDVDGKFSFSVEARAVNLLLSYMGYKDKIQHVNLARQSD
ncbi:MAG: TonB-dependent receptor, partial [Bacteroidales bacterium]|nr:TonB-dependent receptor [Bacteroidales bacterium]